MPGGTPCSAVPPHGGNVRDVVAHTVRRHQRPGPASYRGTGSTSGPRRFPRPWSSACGAPTTVIFGAATKRSERDGEGSPPAARGGRQSIRRTSGQLAEHASHLVGPAHSRHAGECAGPMISRRCKGVHQSSRAAGRQGDETDGSEGAHEVSLAEFIILTRNLNTRTHQRPPDHSMYQPDCVSSPSRRHNCKAS